MLQKPLIKVALPQNDKSYSLSVWINAHVRAHAHTHAHAHAHAHAHTHTHTHTQCVISPDWNTGLSNCIKFHIITIYSSTDTVSDYTVRIIMIRTKMQHLLQLKRYNCSSKLLVTVNKLILSTCENQCSLPWGDGSRWCVDFTNGYFDNKRFLK